MTSSFNTLYQISPKTGDGTPSTGYRLIAVALLRDTIDEIKNGINLSKNFYFLEYHPLGQTCMELLDLNPERVINSLEEYRNGDRWEPAE